MLDLSLVKHGHARNIVHTTAMPDIDIDSDHTLVSTVIRKQTPRQTPRPSDQPARGGPQENTTRSESEDSEAENPLTKRPKKIT